MGFAKPEKLQSEIDEEEDIPSQAELEKETAEKTVEENETVPAPVEEEADYDREIRISIVGKPNVGKVGSRIEFIFLNLIFTHLFSSEFNAL